MALRQVHPEHSRRAQDSAQRTDTAKALALEAYGQLPLSFIPNQGQVDERMVFYYHMTEGVEQ